MRVKVYLAVAVGAMMLSACSTSKSSLPYFTDIATNVEGVLPMNSYVSTIQPDDELLISVSSANPNATAIYNLPLTNPASRDVLTRTTTPRSQTYVVSPSGDIDMPVLGTIHVQGLTLEQIQKLITDKVAKDVSDPLVRVELVNFQVVVAGEVQQPRTVNVTRNRYSILDALGDAGDLTPYGERSRVLVVREVDGKKTYAHLDLNSSDIFSSPYFYLKQNDYVYVEPNSVRQANSKYNQDNAYKLTVVSTIVSAASVIASLVIALTIK